MRPGEALALRPRDVRETPTGMVVHVTGTVVERKGTKAYRQDHPKTAASERHIPVPDFAALILRQRLQGLPATSERTIFTNRTGGVLTPHNVRRTFRDFLQLAGLAESGISLRWYRRTAATVIARGMGTDAAAAFLGHTSTVITEGHYIEPDQAIDRTPTIHLDATLRAVNPNRRLLAGAASDEEESILDELDTDEIEDVDGVAI
jgi:integrase